MMTQEKLVELGSLVTAILQAGVEASGNSSMATMDLCVVEAAEIIQKWTTIGTKAVEYGKAKEEKQP